MECDESRKDKEAVKRCFWTNLFNFKILQKTLEVLLTKPGLLKNELVGCPMFIALMNSVTVIVQNEELTCYEIFKTMLRHEDIHLMNTNMEIEKARTLEQMP